MKEMYLKVNVKDIKGCDSVDVFFRKDRYFICPKDDKNLVKIEDVERRKKLPPTQPEPKTGVWLIYTNIPQYMLCKCSACGADILVPYLGKNTIFNYCPNCGAKMEGDLT